MVRTVMILNIHTYTTWYEFHTNMQHRSVLLLQALRKAEEHILLAKKERSYYRAICDTGKQSVRQLFQEGGSFSPPPTSPRSRPCSLHSPVHYSFDMAQQVHYPSDPLQPGPIYFLTPCKCAIFGVCREAIPRQINYLIDEASDTGKGSNTIVSMLHHFFKEHGLGETDVHLHAATCVGQNKNNTMLHYLIWRVMSGLHRRVTLSFLIVGHTTVWHEILAENVIWRIGGCTRELPN